MSLIRDMKALDGFNNIEKSDDQISSQRLSNEKEKLMRNDLLRIVNGNAMLRASLILLTIVMIFFTVMKICKLFYQIRHHHQRKQEVTLILR